MNETKTLNVEETNRIRAELGLAPLTDDATKEKKKDFVHAPALNLRDKKLFNKDQEKLRENFEAKRLEEELASVKPIFKNENVGTLDFLAEVQKKKEEKERKTQLSDEVKNETESYYNRKYDSKDLRGLKVQHKPEKFDVFKPVILTLKDQGVLDEDDEMLVNVDMVENEKTVKNVRNKKQGRYDDPINSDDEDEEILTGLKPRNVLAKYDEDVDGELQLKPTFTLNEGGRYSMEKEKRVAQFKEDLSRRRIVLNTDDEPKVASDFFSPDEMLSKIKKPRTGRRNIRGGSGRPKPVQEEGEVVEDDSVTVKKEPNTAKREEEEEDENDLWSLDRIFETKNTQTTLINPGLKRGLDQFRKLKAEKTLRDESECRVNDYLSSAREQPLVDSKRYGLQLDNTKEYTEMVYNNLEAKRLAEANALIMEEPKPLPKMPSPPKPAPPVIVKEEKKKPDSVIGGGWQPEESLVAAQKKRNYRSELPTPRQPSPEKKKVKLMDGILGDDVCVGRGLFAAALYAQQKGYLDDDKAKSVLSNPKHDKLKARNYCEEKLRYDDNIDLKYSRRDRNAGPIVKFEDKKEFRNDTRLDYVDETGQKQSPKEAFRSLSHSFHGKGSGKIKTEKRRQHRAQQESAAAGSSNLGPGRVNLAQLASDDRLFRKPKKKFGVALTGKDAAFPTPIKKESRK